MSRPDLAGGRGRSRPRRNCRRILQIRAGAHRRAARPRPARHGGPTVIMAPLVTALLFFQAAGLVGSWRGTSTCVDREHFPNCHDEEVIFDAVARGNTGDTVTVRADKIVQGHREFMGESNYVRGADGLWVAEFRNERVHL